MPAPCRLQTLHPPPPANRHWHPVVQHCAPSHSYSPRQQRQSSSLAWPGRAAAGVRGGEGEQKSRSSPTCSRRESSLYTRWPPSRWLSCWTTSPPRRCIRQADRQGRVGGASALVQTRCKAFSQAHMAAVAQMPPISRPAQKPASGPHRQTDRQTHLQEAGAGAASEAVQQGCHDCREVVSLLGH